MISLVIRVSVEDPGDVVSRSVYSAHEPGSPEDIGVMLRGALSAVTDRIREGFAGGVVRTVTGEVIGEWQYRRA